MKIGYFGSVATILAQRRKSMEMSGGGVQASSSVTDLQAIIVKASYAVSVPIKSEPMSPLGDEDCSFGEMPTVKSRQVAGNLTVIQIKTEGDVGETSAMASQNDEEPMMISVSDASYDIIKH